MAGLTIGWEYLTGRCVATDPTSRQRAEWPPHPGRVFMALAAAWFETGEDNAEGQALQWLETLGDPELGLPDYFSMREVVDCYVPVNDVAGPSKAILQSAPGLTRERKERTFPSVWVGDVPCYLHWPNANAAEVERHRSALEQLCGKVTRIGHSSSLVRMWVADEVPASQAMETWVPDNGLADFQIRRFTEGTLDLLDRQFNRRGREEYQQLSQRIAELKAKKKSATGKGSQQRKSELDEQIAAAESQLERVDPRDPIRPKLSLWTGYRRRQAEQPPAPHSEFDSELLLLAQVDGPRLPAVSTLMVTQALRDEIMARLGSNVPEWVSGLTLSGEPARNGEDRMAIVPLPFVGHEHADGHLLGVGLAFPRSRPRSERGRVLGQFLMDPDGQPRHIVLKLGPIGDWTIRKRDWMEHRQALQPETWTAHPKGARWWASVTPIVLDRFPKQDPCRDHEAWEQEILEIVSKACQRIGLPAPLKAIVGNGSWHRGSPRAVVKRRPLRGHPDRPDHTAALGDGFPLYPDKQGKGHRPQLHICLQFAEPVVGPVILGAGRFLGYGLCKPLGRNTDR